MPISHYSIILNSQFSIIYTYTYDELGGYDADNRLHKSTDALGQQQSIVYDATGNIVSKTDELGRTTNLPTMH
jgi:YD repeat-containing protein